MFRHKYSFRRKWVMNLVLSTEHKNWWHHQNPQYESIHINFLPHQQLYLLAHDWGNHHPSDPSSRLLHYESSPSAAWASATIYEYKITKNIFWSKFKIFMKHYATLRYSCDTASEIQTLFMRFVYGSTNLFIGVSNCTAALSRNFFCISQSTYST